MPSLVPSRPFTFRSTVMSGASELDLDVDTGGEVEAHQGVDGLRRGVDDVDQSLVRAYLEVLARVLVLVGRADDAVHVLLGRQRHRAGDLRTRAGDGVHDLPRRGVDHLVVIGLEPDADLLSRHRSLSSFVSYCLVISRWSVLRSSHRDPPTPEVGRVGSCGTQITRVRDLHRVGGCPATMWGTSHRVSRCGATHSDRRTSGRRDSEVKYG